MRVSTIGASAVPISEKFTQLVEPSHVGTAQLMQPGEGELHLRFHAGRPRHPASHCAFQEDAEQGERSCLWLLPYGEVPRSKFQSSEFRVPS